MAGCWKGWRGYPGPIVYPYWEYRCWLETGRHIDDGLDTIEELR